MKPTKEENKKKAFTNYRNYLKKHCNKKELIEIVVSMYERFASDIIVEVHLKEKT